MSDNLDSLTDDKLSEAFAVEVAGYILHPTPNEPPMSRLEVPEKWCYRDRQGRFYLGEPYPTGMGKMEDGLTFGYMWVCPKFATSADAVLPWLESWRAKHPDEHTVHINKTGPEDCNWSCALMTKRDDDFQSSANTFSRAACIALIRASRATKGQP